MLQLIVIQTTKEYISLGRGNNELKRIDEYLNRRRYKLRRLWRLAVVTHPRTTSRLSLSCGFRGAGPIS